MKRAIFLVIIFLSFQGFSQVESGVYITNEVYDFVFLDGEQVGPPNHNYGDTYIHVLENGFRIYKKEGDTGESYPLVYMGMDNFGYQIYAVPFGNRLEFKDNFMVLFYQFNNNSGWYERSSEYHNLKYLRKEPILIYEE